MGLCQAVPGGFGGFGSYRMPGVALSRMPRCLAVLSAAWLVLLAVGDHQLLVSVSFLDTALGGRWNGGACCMHACMCASWLSLNRTSTSSSSSS